MSNSSTYSAFLSDILRMVNVNDLQLNDEMNYIISHYDKPPRYYHTLQHVKEMFDAFNSIVGDRVIPVNRLHVIYLAIIFHDIIYDCKWDCRDKCVEEASADEFVIFINRVKLSLTDDDLKYGVDLIESTATHQPIDSSIETLAFLDADMYILSRPIEQYMTYATNVRKEWGHIDDIHYSQGRKHFLRDALEQPSVYFTTEMKRQNQNAVSNMEYELKLLENN